VFVFGLGYGGSIALLSPMLADLFGTGNINALLGVTSAAFAIAGSVAPFLAGLSYDVYGSFVPGFLGGAILCVLAAPTLALAERRHHE
jgi:OFA family oxalate/formate antiporter-like MFS transporter